MLLTALVTAAAVSAPLQPPPPKAEPMPNFYSQPARCGPLHDEIVRRVQTAQHGRPAGLHYAVLRKMDGCGLPAPAGYHPDYLLPGHADAPQFRPASDTTAPPR
jgi:hypothetical protein